MKMCIAAMIILLTPGWSPASQPAPAPADALLGLEIGMEIEEARGMLARLGEPDSRPTREGGTKEVWRLVGTDFAWVAMKADGRGRLLWITGHRRKGHELPFAVVSASPQLATDDTAIWHTTGRHAAQRLTLKGRGRMAQVVTLSEVH